ncbi:MAG: hypothetical protein JNL60_02190 [Bacteroidia bacterium]|nr:hypothetical protein [Bacteroidia bacterium]
MKRSFSVFLFSLYSTIFFAQNSEEPKTYIFGIMGTYDLTYNFPDKVLNPGLQRKWTFGFSITNKKRDFILFAGAGLKGAKFDLYGQTFRASFIKDVQQNYVALPDSGEAQLIAREMNAGGKGLWGTYAHHAAIGFMWNKGIRPCIFFYVGSRDLLLQDSEFAKYEDPEHGDIDYVSMDTKFYEIKIGCGLPGKVPYAINFTLGYKWTNYGDLKFKNTPLSDYTTGSLKNKYGFSGGFTASICCMIWSNYGWD